MEDEVIDAYILAAWMCLSFLAGFAVASVVFLAVWPKYPRKPKAKYVIKGGGGFKRKNWPW